MIDAAVLNKRIAALKALPGAALELRQALANPRVHLEQLEAILLRDPGLCANVLRLGNSAAFGLSRQVSDVRQVLTLLGSGRIAELTLAAALSSILPKQLEGFGISSTEFLEHSVVVAVLSRAIAMRHASLLEPIAFTAGLLHDIGKLVISGFIVEEPALLDAVRGQSHMIFVDAEREYLGTDHAEVGALLCERWQLPPLLILSNHWHHSPAHAGEGDGRTLSRIVHLADVMAHVVGAGADVGGMTRRLDESEAEALGMDGHHRESLLSDVLDSVITVRKELRQRAGGES